MELDPKKHRVMSVACLDASQMKQSKFGSGAT